MNDLEKELAAPMIGELDLEDIQLDTLTADTPSCDEGFGLDSIGILEVALLTSKKHGFEPHSGDPDNQKVFASLGSLAAYMAEHRMRQARVNARHIPLSMFGRTDAMPMTGASTSYLIPIPNYSPDHRVDDTARSARAQWNPVWVMVDDSTDGSTGRLQAVATQDPGLRMIMLPHNRGKGVAVLADLETAAAAGPTYVLTMDTGGQHPADLIPKFIAASQTAPDAMILGQLMFNAAAPQMRVQGRRLSNGCADIETLWAGIGDALLGFHIYPVAPLAGIMRQQSRIRGLGFDPEAAIRLYWAGVRPIRLAAPVRYFRPNEGGVSYFRYLCGNILLIAMHLRLVAEGLLRLPSMIAQHLQRGWWFAAGGFTPLPWRPWPGAVGFLRHVRPVAQQTDCQSRRRRPWHLRAASRISRQASTPCWRVPHP